MYNFYRYNFSKNPCMERTDCRTLILDHQWQKWLQYIFHLSNLSCQIFYWIHQNLSNLLKLKKLKYLSLFTLIMDSDMTHFRHLKKRYCSILTLTDFGLNCFKIMASKSGFFERFEIVDICTDKNTFFDGHTYKTDIGQHFDKNEKIR